MSHLKVHVVKSRHVIKDANKLLASIDLDQLARVPVVGDIIVLGEDEFEVEKVKVFPNHGATLIVIEW